MEPSDTGLSTTMTNFWDSWNQLSNTPESSSAKTLVAEDANTLAKAINENYSQLETMEVNAGDIIRQDTQEVSSILNQVKDLNIQIKAVIVSGQTPNDLMDRRDLLLDQLSNKFNFDTKETDFEGIEIIPKGYSSTDGLLKDGTINQGVAFIDKITYTGGKWEAKIYLDGVMSTSNERTIEISDSDIENYVNLDLDQGKIDDYLEAVKNDGTELKYKFHSVYYNPSTTDPSVIEIEPTNFENGSLNGYETISKEINNYKDQLNNLARVIAISVNTIHSNSNVSTSGVNFFNSDAEDSKSESAKLIAVNSDILNDPTKIDAAKVSSANSGNGERALRIAQVRNMRMDILKITDRDEFISNVFSSPFSAGTDLAVADLKSSTNGAKLDDFFKDTISGLGASSQETQRMVTNQTALINQLESRRESISGVSLDEEMTNMLQFQRSYEANAKMISVIDQLLDVVVNGLIKG
jgi:flagellar hook-associated protein 1 FlgK